MAALTGDLIVDRVRSILVAPPFGFTEAPTWQSFDEVPTTAIDGSFRIPPMASQRVIGGFGFYEDRTDSLQVWIARKHNLDYPVVRRALLRDVHSLTAAITRDGHTGSGDYAVLDDGRGHSLQTSPGKEYVTLRLTLPINYDAQL